MRVLKIEPGQAGGFGAPTPNKKFNTDSEASANAGKHIAAQVAQNAAGIS
jgi:hypothetical protein